jgi:Holliday junction resolvase RusA-like endonuclease
VEEVGVVSLVADEFGRLRLDMVLALPPTDNHIYFNVPRGGRALTKEARKYKSLVKEKTARAAITSSLSFREHIPYRVDITIFVKLLSKGWPKRAKWKFQKIDTTNRTKLLLDSIAEAIGVDDRHVTQVTIRKEDDSEDPRVEVTVEELWNR